MKHSPTRVVLYNRRYPMVPGLIVAERLAFDGKLERNVWSSPKCVATATEELAAATTDNKKRRD